MIDYIFSEIIQEQFWDFFKGYDFMRMKLEQKSVVSEGVYYSIVVDKKKGQGTFFKSPQERLGGFVIKGGKIQA